jgi:hypothetical protein
MKINKGWRKVETIFFKIIYALRIHVSTLGIKSAAFLMGIPLLCIAIAPVGIARKEEKPRTLTGNGKASSHIDRENKPV